MSDGADSGRPVGSKGKASSSVMFDEGLCYVLDKAADRGGGDMAALVAAVARAEVDIRRERNNAVLWRTLVGGLLLLMFLDISLLFYGVVAGRDISQAAITIFTAVLSGLLGLFVRPPGRSGEGTEVIGVPARNGSSTDGGRSPDS